MYAGFGVTRSQVISELRLTHSGVFQKTQILISIGLTIGTLVRGQGLRVPDLLRILIDAAITREEPHPAHAGDALLQPSILILEGLVDQPVRLDVRGKVVRDEVVIAVLGDAVAQGGEPARVAERVRLDGREHLGEFRVELEGAVVVGVPEVLDVLGQVAEEEDVGVADLAGDFDLSSHAMSVSGGGWGVIRQIEVSVRERLRGGEKEQ